MHETGPSTYEEFLLRMGDLKTLMRAIEGDEEAHDVLHELPTERHDHLICYLVGAFNDLTKRKGWFRRFIHNFRLIDLKDESELRQMYSNFMKSGYGES